VRLNIERIRTLVLVAGILLVAANAVFLGVDKWRHSLLHSDVPKRLGVNIQQEANGVTYTQAHGGRTIFKIHASRVFELKNDHATLHDVLIELYGRTGASVDRIRGMEFDYNNKTGTATASGAVEITLEQPVAAAGPGHRAKPGTPNQIHVQTSGIVFNQQTGMVTTAQRVEFSTSEAAGSAVGASYDSERDLLVLERDVELTAHPAATRGRTPAPVALRAQHAEFDQNARICYLTGAWASTSGDQATAARAQVLVGADGSAENLSVTGGFTLATAAGSHLAAPKASLQFNQRNQPSLGRLEGGVKLNSASEGRTVSGSSQAMDLAFDGEGQLRRAHMAGGVELASSNVSETADGGVEPVETAQTWRSPVAELDFHAAARGQVAPSAIRGSGGVEVTSQTRRGNGPALPSRLFADALSGRFGAQGILRSMSGAGHARIEQTGADGARQVATGERLEARFAPAAAQGRSRGPAPVHGAGGSEGGPAQIQSVVLDGHVTLNEQPALKPGAAPQTPLLATADRAEYQGAGQRLRLTGNPHVRDGGMDMTADALDFTQATGDGFAQGNVKATWMEGAADQGEGAQPVLLGGRGPMHAIAAEADFHHSSGEASFRGHARLWQQDNSISGPLIVLDREKQTLVARTSQAAEPVTVVMLGAPGPKSAGGARGGMRQESSSAPAVIRVRGGDLWYSGEERRAILRAAPLAAVTAQSGAVESTSKQVELFLAPAGAAAGAAGAGLAAQVERMVASGHVVLSAQGRRGTGEQLAYTSRTGAYVLTGTASAPPRLTDPQYGSVTGSALIFNSRNDSVSIEGRGQETMTETTVPR
jgi:lipopolysaccharide export system protein LptA